MPVSLRTARHRAVGRPTTAMTDLAESATGSLAQIGTRESIADVARVIGRQVSAIVWRTHGQERLEELYLLTRPEVDDIRGVDSSATLRCGPS